MNKTDLVKSISKDTGLSKTKSIEVLEAFISNISESLANGEKVTLAGFGTFATTKRDARKGRNPKTGEVIDIQSKVITRFKASSELNRNVN